jgi:hypothetical protein
MKSLGLGKFVGFIRHYGDEAKLIANALQAVAHPFLDPSERRAIQEVVDRLSAAGDNIAKSLPALEKASAIRIDKNDVKEALEEMLPDIIGRVVKELAKDKSAD